MRTARAAIAAGLALGMPLIGASAAHALSALTTDHTASAAQYGMSPLEQPGAGRGGPGEGGVDLGGPGGPGGPADEGGFGDTPQAVGDRPGAIAPGAAGVVQPARQLAAGGVQGLPFTGLAAVWILLAGVALLAAGLALQRHDRRMLPHF